MHFTFKDSRAHGTPRQKRWHRNVISLGMNRQFSFDPSVLKSLCRMFAPKTETDKSLKGKTPLSCDQHSFWNWCQHPLRNANTVCPFLPNFSDSAKHEKEEENFPEHISWPSRSKCTSLSLSFFLSFCRHDSNMKWFLLISASDKT